MVHALHPHHSVHSPQPTAHSTQPTVHSTQYTGGEPLQSKSHNGYLPSPPPLHTHTHTHTHTPTAHVCRSMFYVSMFYASHGPSTSFAPCRRPSDPRTSYGAPSDHQSSYLTPRSGVNGARWWRGGKEGGGGGGGVRVCVWDEGMLGMRNGACVCRCVQTCVNVCVCVCVRTCVEEVGRSWEAERAGGRGKVLFVDRHS